MENLSHIYVLNNYKNSLSEEIKTNEEEFYKYLLKENILIQNYIP